MLLAVIRAPRITPCRRETRFKSASFLRITSARMMPATPEVSARYAYTENSCGMSLMKTYVDDQHSVIEKSIKIDSFFVIFP